MLKFCNNTTLQLLASFNANILDSKDKILQAAFYNISVNEDKFNNKENTLFELIRRHYNKNISKPVASFIGGPYHLTRHIGYFQGINYNIYTFGEIHDYKIDCPNKKYQTIEKYLEDLVDTTDVFIDIYFEFPAYREMEYNLKNMYGNSRLGKLFTKFLTCVQSLTRKSEMCKTSRTHYIDSRRLELIGTSEPNWLGMWILNNIRHYTEIEIQKTRVFVSENKLRILDIFKQFLDSDFNNFANYWISQLFKTSLVNKELNRSFLELKIVNFIVNKIRKEAYKLYTNKRVINNINYLILNIENIDKNYIKHLSDFDLDTVAINSIIMDAYTLARIFKEFNVSNHLIEPIKPQNIIIYAGDNHCENYREFFELIGLNLVEKSGEYYGNINKLKYKNCLDMRNINQPLFLE